MPGKKGDLGILEGMPPLNLPMPGCTLVSDTVLLFGMATHFWPLTVCLSRLVYRVCRMLMHASTLNLVRIQMTYKAAI